MIPLRILFVVTFASLALPARALDFGDHSSATITGKAWDALNSENYADAIDYAKKCVELYEKQAIEMQKGLAKPVSGEDREAVLKLWALNDVGTCFFIMGRALENQQRGKEAISAYKQLVEEVPFAQAWDPQGWFWKPADGAKARIKVLEFDMLK